MGERHHTVPQFYLSRFANDRGQVEMVSRTGGEPILTSVLNAAAETDFYTIVPDEEADTEVHPRVIEDLLGRIEDQGAAAIDRILSDGLPPSDKTRYDLANYISLQAVRTWAWHADFERSTDLAMKAHIRSDLEYNPHSVFKPVADDLDRFVIHVGKNNRLGLMLKQMVDLGPYIFAMAWRLYVQVQPTFLTSDEPVGVWTRPGRSGPAGVLSADAVYFPLSPTHALGLLRSDVEERAVTASDTRSDHINVAVASGARRWVFVPPGGSPLDGGELPPVRQARFVRAERWEDSDGRIHELNVLYRG